MSVAMEWGGDAKLGRQRSCACPPEALDFGGWCSRSGRRRSLGLGLGRRCADGLYDDEEGDELAPLEYCAAGARPSRPGWRGLWRRIVKGKRRIFGEAAAAARVPYDPFTYAQNFEEQGAMPWVEPENLSRSFSARFANPSGLLRRFA
ncbi:hypothetical protein Taro_007940 [Colocasia esculenta]|uniref:Uncharacterized protein n=1 Tax=Colocasia esculenta TaxID=4460 RepID=A0A843U0H7_COLES|nr:hypothetical protein [Colocasia esculenta]